VLVATTDIGGHNLQNNPVIALSVPQSQFGKINALDFYDPTSHVRYSAVVCHESSPSVDCVEAAGGAARCISFVDSLNTNSIHPNKKRRETTRRMEVSQFEFVAASLPRQVAA
jgi:hypothetical protein